MKATPTTTETKDKELTTLVPQQTLTFQAAGEVTVKPFRFTQFPRVIEILGSFTASISSLDNLQASDIVRMLTKNDGDEVFQLLCMATGKDRAWLDQLEADEGLELMMIVVEQNMDFFNQKVIPAITKFSTKAGAIGKDGENSSAD